LLVIDSTSAACRVEIWTDLTRTDATRWKEKQKSSRVSEAKKLLD